MVHRRSSGLKEPSTFFKSLQLLQGPHLAHLKVNGFLGCRKMSIYRGSFAARYFHVPMCNFYSSYRWLEKPMTFGSSLCCRFLLVCSSKVRVMLPKILHWNLGFSCTLCAYLFFIISHLYWKVSRRNGDKNAMGRMIWTRQKSSITCTSTIAP